MAEMTCGLSNDLASLVMTYETKDELVCCCTLLLLNSSTETEVSKKVSKNVMPCRLVSRQNYAVTYQII